MSEMGYIEYIKRRIRDFIGREIHKHSQYWNNEKEGIVVVCITVKENGDIVFEFDKKGFKSFRKAGIVEVHPKGVTGNPSFSIKNWNTKKHRRNSVAIVIKDEKNNINKIELNKKVIERKWKQEDKKIFKKR